LTGEKYYKPWELLPEESDRIARQIKEAEATINHELENFKRKQLKGREEEYTQGEDADNVNKLQESSAAAAPEASNERHKPSAMPNGDANDAQMHSEAKQPPLTNNPDAPENEREKLSKDAGDDAGEGELEQGEEDTVLY
jgi:hypothetical protein